MSQQADITGISGNDLEYDVTITYDGSPLDLSGVTVTAAIRIQPWTDTLTFTTSSGLTITDPAAGQLTWDIPNADTTPSGSFAYHIDITDSGKIGTALYGTLTLTAP